MNGDCEITVFIHETGHSLDSHALNPQARHAVTDDHGQTSQQENFA
ncbi:hypothetical protein MY1884_004496 [Beauveria asiatica]